MDGNGKIKVNLSVIEYHLTSKDIQDDAQVAMKYLRLNLKVLIQPWWLGGRAVI